MTRALACLAFALCAATTGIAAAEDAASFIPVTADELPEEFRDAPAVILLDRHHWNVVPARRATYRVERRLLVLNRRGFGFADQYVSYDKREGSIDSFYARTILPDGEIIPVPDDLRHELVTYEDEEQEWRSLHFTFPKVRVGAVLEWGYTLSEKDPNVSKWWGVQEEIPVIEARFSMRVKQPVAYFPLSAKVYTRIDHGDRCKVVQDDAGPLKVEFELLCQNVPGTVDEALSPPRADTSLEFVIGWPNQDFDIEAWNIKAELWNTIIQKYINRRPAVANLAKELIDEGMSDEDKVNAIYGFIKREMEVRTVYFAQRQRGKQSSFRSVDEMLAHGGGLPHEITMLTLALLREAGIGAAPVLAHDRTEGRFLLDFPDMSQAGHLMLRVNIDGQEALLDPSCRYCEAGAPDWRYCDDRDNALGINLFAQPFAVGVVPANYSAEIREERATLVADGSASVQGTVIWTGHSEIELRRSWDSLSVAARQGEFRSMLVGNIDQTAVEISNPEEFFEHLSAKYAIRRRDLPPLPDGRLLVRPVDVFTPKLQIPMQEERVHPLWLPYPYSVQSKVVFQLPEGFEVHDLPPKGESISGPGMIFKHVWRNGPGPGEVTWTGQLVVGRTDIQVEQYDEARQFARRVRYVLRGGVVAGPYGGVR